MKKFLFALAVIIIANLGCKKEEVGGGGLCACSPMRYPYLSLVVKDAAGVDFLNAKTTGYFPIGKIQLYLQEADGTIKNIDFTVRPPFSYGNSQFTFHQIYSTAIVATAMTKTGTLYLKLGDNSPRKLSLQLSSPTKDIEKLLIDDKEAIAETGAIRGYSDGNIFNLQL